ncbi:hypothetical protein ACFYP4_02445 [Streptomyces sp. NPDC005551]|uniref:hypothetical protein n=1 Tax=Streptomyces sp. NPDC005551 TaxID=3364725 RepID=UPI0036A23344
MTFWRRKPKWHVDMEAVERTVRAELEEKHRAEVNELRGQIRWMLDTATDKQLVAWAADAGRRFSEMPDVDVDPDWEGRAKDAMMHGLLKVLELQSRVAELESELAMLKREKDV